MSGCLFSCLSTSANPIFHLCNYQEDISSHSAAHYQQPPPLMSHELAVPLHPPGPSSRHKCVIFDEKDLADLNASAIALEQASGNVSTSGAFGVVREASLPRLGLGSGTFALKTLKVDATHALLPKESFLLFMRNCDRIDGLPHHSRLLGANIETQATLWEFHHGINLEEVITKDLMSPTQAARFSLEFLQWLSLLDTFLPQTEAQAKVKVRYQILHLDLKVRVCVAIISIMWAQNLLEALL